MKKQSYFGLFVFLFFAFGQVVLARDDGDEEDANPLAAHRVCQFELPPHPDYYYRDFEVKTRGSVIFAPAGITRSNPQNSGGFQAKWLRPGQAMGVLGEATRVTVIGGSCEQVDTVLPQGIKVVYDTHSLAILARVDCANKVVSGQFKMPPPPAPKVQAVTQMPKKCEPKEERSGPTPLPDGTVQTTLKVTDEDCKITETVRLEKSCPKCDPEKSWQHLAGYKPQISGGPKVRLDQLLDGHKVRNKKLQSRIDSFWLIDQKGRERISAAIRQQYPQYLKQKWNLVLLEENACDGLFYLEVYRDGVHKRELLVGIGIGVGAGIGIGIAIDSYPIVKAPFNQIPNPLRP